MDLEPYKVSNQKPLFMNNDNNPLKLDWNESTVAPSQVWQAFEAHPLASCKRLCTFSRHKKLLLVLSVNYIKYIVIYESENASESSN